MGWNTLARMPHPHQSGHAAVALNGKVLVLYGIWQPPGVYLDTSTWIDTFDTATQTWQAGESPSGAPRQSYSAAVASAAGRIWQFGGRYETDAVYATTQSWAPGEASWSTHSGQVLRVAPAAATGPDGKIYIVGGSIRTDAATQDTAGWVYDPAADTLTSIAPMPRGRVRHGAAFGADGRLYVAGGATSDGTGSKVDAYDPATNTWSTVANRGDASTAGSRAVTSGGTVYLLTSSGGSVVTEAYSPTTDSWFTVNAGTLVRNKMFAAAAGGDGYIYLLGGDGDAYDPPTSYGGTTAASLPVNNPPNAPTLISPSSGATIDRTTTNRFTLAPSDPDPGDSTSQTDWRHRLIGAASWTTVSQALPLTFIDFPAGTFEAGDHEWQALTYDTQGVAGKWSPSSFFTAATPPPGPTILSPTNEATVSSSETVTWSTANQDAYQLRRVADNAGAADTGTVYYDTGEVPLSGARSSVVEFPTNDRYEHVQLHTKTAGLWSSWMSVRVHVSFTPPATASLVVAIAADIGANTVTISNPAPAAGEPAASYNDLYVRCAVGNPAADEFRPYDETGTRIAALKPLNSVFIDRSPASGVVYEYRVVTVADNGTFSTSAWTAVDAIAEPTIYYGGAY